MKSHSRFVLSFLLAYIAIAITAATASAITITEPFGPNWFFQPPENLGPVVNSSYYESTPTISSDGLTLIISSSRPGGNDNSRDLWQSTRASLDTPWTEPATLGWNVNSSLKESAPELSSDGLSLFFYRQDPGIGPDSADLYQSTRSTPTSPWGLALPMSDINSNYPDTAPSISADGLTLMFQSTRPPTFGVGDLWQATRSSMDGPWGSPSNMGALFNTTTWDGGPSLSADDLTLIWSSNRSGGVGRDDLWRTSRDTTSSPWNVPMRLSAAVNTNVSDGTADFTTDARTIFFNSSRSGGYGGHDIWSSTAIPASAYTRFSEVPIGMRSFPGGVREMGFATTIIAETNGAERQLGVFTSERPRLRMRSIEAETIFLSVDLSDLVDVEFVIDVRNSNTSWEADDYVVVELTDGTETITVIDFDTPAELNTAEGVWRNYRADVPDDWTQATLSITSRSNSGTGAEIFDFDDVAFFGTPVPEPTMFALALFGLIGLGFVGRRRW